MRDQNPEPEEEEEVEETKPKSGRSAFFAGVYQADNFTGAFRGVKPAPHGGTAYVGPDQMPIGSEDDCWCGQPLGHTWPGKDGGAPHPREDTTVTSQTKSTPTEADRLEMRDLRKFDSDVARMMCELTNVYNIRFRIAKDGVHVFLYPPEGSGSRPFKVGASRPGTTQMRYLERWVAEHVAPTLRENQVAALAAKFNDPSKRTREKRAVKAVPAPVASEPTPEPEPAPDPAPAPPAPTGEPPVPFSGDAPKGYHQHLTVRDHHPTNWWEADRIVPGSPTNFLCKSCDYTAISLTSGGAAHQRMHSMTAEQRAVVSRAGHAAKDHDAIGRRVKVRNAVKVLIEDYGLHLPTEDDKATRRAVKQVEKLTDQLAKVTAERDELKARLDLLREAMKA